MIVIWKLIMKLRYMGLCFMIASFLQGAQQLYEEISQLEIDGRFDSILFEETQENTIQIISPLAESERDALFIATKIGKLLTLKSKSNGGNTNMTVVGNSNVTIGGGTKMMVAGNSNVTIGGGTKMTVVGNSNVTIGGGTKMTVVGNSNITIGGTLHKCVDQSFNMGSLKGQNTEEERKKIDLIIKYNSTLLSTVTFNVSSGNITIPKIRGKLITKISGCATFQIEEIQESSLIEQNISGSGSILMNRCEAKNVLLNISGSGDIKIRSLACEDLKASISGAGEILLENGNCEKLSCKISGSGTIESHVHTTNPQISLTGSGCILANHVKGDPETKILGAGDVHINGRKIPSKYQNAPSVLCAQHGVVIQNFF
ncbi:MAG: hypothetical protein CNLJKLNK_00444 [Holosporales bacterium]